MDDVIGGAAAWENVDSTEGRFRSTNKSLPANKLDLLLCQEECRIYKVVLPFVPSLRYFLLSNNMLVTAKSFNRYSYGVF